MNTSQAHDHDRARQRARQEVRALRGDYQQAMVYAAVMVMLVLINIMSGDAWRGNWWVQWPAMPWGVVLIIHGILATRGNSLFGPDWEDRKVEELMKRKGQSGS